MHRQVLVGSVFLFCLASIFTSDLRASRLYGEASTADIAVSKNVDWTETLRGQWKGTITNSSDNHRCEAKLRIRRGKKGLEAKYYNQCAVAWKGWFPITITDEDVEFSDGAGNWVLNMTSGNLEGHIEAQGGAQTAQLLFTK